MTKKLIITLAALVLLSGCATVSKSGLYWGKYSDTLYNLKNKPSSKTRAKHVAELNKIILKSQELKLRVPPGIYAELGMYTLEDGKRNKAKEYFNLELATYPESRAMVSQILKKQ